jgi:hypothetical protein
VAALNGGPLRPADPGRPDDRGGGPDLRPAAPFAALAGSTWHHQLTDGPDHLTVFPAHPDSTAVSHLRVQPVRRAGMLRALRPFRRPARIVELVGGPVLETAPPAGLPAQQASCPAAPRCPRRHDRAPGSTRTPTLLAPHEPPPGHLPSPSHQQPDRPAAAPQPAAAPPPPCPSAAAGCAVVPGCAASVRRLPHPSPRAARQQPPDHQDGRQRSRPRYRREPSADGHANPKAAPTSRRPA